MTEPWTANAPGLRPPFWARWTGHELRDTSYRYKWGEIAPDKWEVAIKTYRYDNAGIYIGMLIVGIYIRANWLLRFKAMRQPSNGFGPSYGFVFKLSGPEMLFLNWGDKSKIIYRPWRWDPCGFEELTADGRWIRWDWSSNDQPEKWSETYPYHYMTKYGDAQHCDAKVERRRHVMKYKVFGLTVRAKTIHSIDVHFSEEMGSERGSWKGGVVGTAHDMHPGESPRATLSRMMRERNFCR